MLCVFYHYNTKAFSCKAFFSVHKAAGADRCLFFCLVCGHLAVLHGGREHDLRPRPSKMLQLADKLVELNGANKKALIEHGVITGNAITFHDIVDLFNIGIKFFFLNRLNLEVDERFDRISQKRRI